MTSPNPEEVVRHYEDTRPLPPAAPPPPPQPPPPHHHLRPTLRMVLRRGVVASLVALAGLIVSDHFGGLLGTAEHRRVDLILAVSGAAVFLVFAIVAVRATTNDVIGRVPKRLGDARAATLRLLCLLAGYILVILGALSLLRVPVAHLLLAGTVTGVILGIAAQQVLANTFAGIMLLFARPFGVGDEVVIRSGALGGPVTGTVSGMTLTYVSVATQKGEVLLPNSAVLAAAIGPAQWLG
jgi:small-conductance mechanosensitive channel